MTNRTVIGDLPRINALRMPQGEAYVDDERRFTWFDYDVRINRAANLFRHELGVVEGARIAVLAGNCVEFLDVAFAASRIKAIATGLNTRHTPREMLQQLMDSAPSTLIVDEGHLDTGRELSMAVGARLLVVGKSQQGVPSYSEMLDAAPADAVYSHGDPEAVYTLCYTSGTTGEPKGAMINSRNELAYQASMAWVAESVATDRHLVSLPLFHRGGQFATMHPARLGLPVVLLDSSDPEVMMGTIERERITVTMAVPTVIKVICDVCEATPDRYDLSSLRMVLYGSNPIPEDLLRRFLRLFDCGVCQIGGIGTEGGVGLSLSARQHREALIDPEKHHRLRSCGTIQPLTEMKLVDDADRDVSVGDTGEMVFRGDSFISGYWGRPEASAGAWRSGWFHSGDIGRMDADGFVYYVDRMAGRIKTGGETVFAREVETFILQCPGVADVCVVGVPDELWGEAVCAVVQCEAGAHPSEEAIRQAVRSQLAGYKVPKRVVYVDVMPKTALGKTSYGEVRRTAVALLGITDGDSCAVAP